MESLSYELSYFCWPALRKQTPFVPIDQGLVYTGKLEKDTPSVCLADAAGANAAGPS